MGESLRIHPAGETALMPAFGFIRTAQIRLLDAKEFCADAGRGSRPSAMAQVLIKPVPLYGGVNPEGNNAALQPSEQMLRPLAVFLQLTHRTGSFAAKKSVTQRKTVYLSNLRSLPSPRKICRKRKTRLNCRFQRRMAACLSLTL